ncbi:MAG: restriction endonuclease subunit S [Selenomonadaceae bacterium]|nr:restriction endonuclease subunit S [Selenomonadaceae bacterium]
MFYGKLHPYLNKHGVATFDGVCLPKFIEYAVANSKGINLPRVSEKNILSAEISLPPPEEQKEIVRLLDDLLGREQRTTPLR